MDTGPVCHAVCLFTSQRLSQYQIILLGDRGTLVNNLSKVVTRQCPSAESNLCLWVTSGLQVQHVTVRLPSHAVASYGTVWQCINLLTGQMIDSEWPLRELDNVVQTTMKWGSWPLEICRDNYLCLKPNIVAENLRIMVCIIMQIYYLLTILLSKVKRMLTQLTVYLWINPW